MNGRNTVNLGVGTSTVSDRKKNHNEIEKSYATHAVVALSNSRKELKKTQNYEKK